MMDDTKYGQAGAGFQSPTADDTAPDIETSGEQATPVSPAEAAVSPAVQRFQSCRWRATPDAGEYCTHRDVLPFAGKEGFSPDSWCPDCSFYKLRRTPKKRERIDYGY